MVLATKSMGLNPDVLSFAYADMSSVSSPRLTRKNIRLGTERLVQFYSSDPEDLGIEIEHSVDGYVRIASTAGDGMYEGTVHVGDIVCEIAGVNMRRPITEHMWKLTTGLMKVAPRPIEVIVAAEEHASSKESDEEEKLRAIGTLPDKKDAENTQTPSLVKQAMSVWQNLNLNGGSKEEYHDSPGNGTSDTGSMSDGNEGSTVQTPDPFSDPERFGVERSIIFNTESLGIKLHRCQNEGIVQILHVDQNVSEEVRNGDDNGRLDVGDVIVEVGGVDLRHKFIGPLEWADMVYFVQNVGRPLDMVVVEDNHCARERDGDSGVTYNVEQEFEEDTRDEGDVENTGVTEVENDAKDEYEATNSIAIEASEHLISIEGEGDPEVDEEVDAIEVVAVEEAAGKEVDQESAIELVSIEEVVEEVVEEADHKVVLELDETLEEGADEEDLSIDDECYEEDDESEHKQKDTYGNEISDDELSEMMMSQVEQFEASKEKDVYLSVPAKEEEPVQEVEIKRTRQQIEGELSQLPKFSPEWFSLKSELIELRASEGDLEQKRPTSSFYFRTHPNKSSVSEVPLPFLSKGTDSSVVSMESMATSESSLEPPLTPTSIIEEEDAFEVTMWAGPMDNKPKEDNAFSTFRESLFGMDDSDTEEPFTGGINFDAPPRVPVSDLFSHAFVVNRAGDVGSPLFVVKKTLPNQNKANEFSSYLQMDATRRQAQEAKMPNAKPALDMNKIALHQEMSLESAQSVESAWDTADFAKEVDAQADSFFLDSLCGDSMCESLINNSSDMRQKKEKPEKPRRKRLFGKLRKNKKKDEAKMLGYGSLDDDTEDYRSATAALALQKFKSKKTAEFTGFHPIDDEVDL
mmetsp:Transcript_19391/g.27625  ORF Transcript_19391/g.27625 Transcript_19391/m.27625 type:complete len:860 (+) Transcript_19391:97-2676(+)